MHMCVCGRAFSCLSLSQYYKPFRHVVQDHFVYCCFLCYRDGMFGVGVQIASCPSCNAMGWRMRADEQNWPAPTLIISPDGRGYQPTWLEYPFRGEAAPAREAPKEGQLPWHCNRCG